MRAPSFITRQGRETWIVTPAAVPAWQPASEPAWLAGRLSADDGNAEEFANRLFRWEGLAAPPSDVAEPYTLQWFLAIEHLRITRQAPWLPRLLEFGKHAGETLLGLGNGLGTDWLQYARHGARVIACSPHAAELALVRRNFELRGLKGKYLHAQPSELPLDSTSVDVVCITELLHEVSDAEAVIGEVFRVLKPGGKVLAVVPARYGAHYWRRVLGPWSQTSPEVRRSPWHVPGRMGDSAKDYTAHGLRRLFAAFTDHRIHKRHLRRRDIPWAWRWLPTEWLEKLIGRFLIVKAFKPVSCATPVHRLAA